MYFYAAKPFRIIQKLTSFSGTWLFTTIGPIWKMVTTIAITTFENSGTVTVVLTVSLTNITLAQIRAARPGTCMIFTTGIGFSATVGAVREIFITDPTNEVANTLFIISTWTLIISTYFCAINFIAT